MPRAVPTAAQVARLVPSLQDVTALQVFAMVPKVANAQCWTGLSVLATAVQVAVSVPVPELHVVAWTQ